MTPRLARVLLLVTLAIGALRVASAAEPATMRLDFFHTGGRGIEVFAVDRVVIEPLPWPGNTSRTIDTSNLGVYRFEVRDPAGRVLYSRGYASIFAEWASTPEAADAHRTFAESLRFPAPKGPVEVVVQKRNAAQAFETVWTTSIDPADMFVDRAPPPRQELLEIERHGAPADKVDLLLIGDGYTAAECAAKFRPDAERMARALFGHEPFKSRRADFNVWGLCPPAAASGVARPSTGVHRRTPVGASYDAFGSERYVLTFDNRAFRDVAAWAPYEFVTILVNGDTYGGGGIFGVYSTVAVDNDWANYLFVHEFGHHFAALADEYYTSPVAYQPVTDVVEPWEPNGRAQVARPGREGHACPDALAQGGIRGPAARVPGAPQADPRGPPPGERDVGTVPRGAGLHDAAPRAVALCGQGRRLPGRELRRPGVLPPATRLRHVHAGRSTVLPRLRTGHRRRDRSLRGAGAVPLSAAGPCRPNSTSRPSGTSPPRS